MKGRIERNKRKKKDEEKRKKAEAEAEAKKKEEDARKKKEAEDFRAQLQSESDLILHGYLFDETYRCETQKSLKKQAEYEKKLVFSVLERTPNYRSRVQENEDMNRREIDMRSGKSGSRLRRRKGREKIEREGAAKGCTQSREERAQRRATQREERKES